MRLIDADALIAEMHNVTLEDGEDRRTFYEVIERQPTIDAVEVVHGEWIGGKYDFYCSQCGVYQNFYTGKTNYCPNCGAKMEVE